MEGTDSRGVPDEQLFTLKDFTPWYANIVNYLVSNKFPSHFTKAQRDKLKSDAKHYVWDDPYLWKHCADLLIGRCIPDNEIVPILTFCHSYACGGHFGARRTAQKMSRARLDKAMVKKKEVDKKLVAKDILSFTLAEQGSFVREIFLNETAKGLDAFGQATINSIASVTAAYLPLPFLYLSSHLTDEDVVNLRNFSRLVLLVSGLRESGAEIEMINIADNHTSSTLDIYKLLNQLPPTDEIQPILAFVNELPLEQQRQLFSLPVEVLGRLISRVAARTIRRFFL